MALNLISIGCSPISVVTNSRFHFKYNFVGAYLKNDLRGGKYMCGSKTVQALPDSKFQVAHMEPTWVLSTPGRPHVGLMNLAIRAVTLNFFQ